MLLLPLVVLPLGCVRPAAAELAAPAWAVSGSVSSQTAELVVPDGAALYLTLRPASGGVGPVGAQRLPLRGRVNFPLAVSLSSEADALPDAPPLESWRDSQLLLSARLDWDGDASTRNAEDLVGRTTLRPTARRDGSGSDLKASWEAAALQLQGRGFAGRLLTQRQ